MSDQKNHQAYLQRLDRLSAERYEKVAAMREEGLNPFANAFEVSHTAKDVFAEWGQRSKESLEEETATVRVAGRVRFVRKMGKAMFIKIQDRTSKPGLKDNAIGPDDSDNFLQIYVSKDSLGDEAFAHAKRLDIGDIIGIEGGLMRTRTGELTIEGKHLTTLTKSVRPLPEKFKGLSDVEQRFRHRYVDLIMNEDVREIFEKRVKIIRLIREFLDERGFMEVETPMMHVTPGGAAAKPFVTHHNALDMPLYMRIAPELYLKRLLVGGFERVYEINRNFRNEGLSRRHNPEFTMVEFYQAYATYDDLMDLTENMITSIAREVVGTQKDGQVVVHAEGHVVNLSKPWRRVRVDEAVAEAWDVPVDTVRDPAWLKQQVDALKLELPDDEPGRMLMELFEEKVEHTLIQPTFIIDFPASVSPLARRKESNPDEVDRYELFVLGRELANAFSELNDPEDQYTRFADQLAARDAGDEEAMPMDEDYVHALEYGMPPAAGQGIGIDRLVMLLTGAESIREVILFPHLRPEHTSVEPDPIDKD